MGNGVAGMSQLAPLGTFVRFRRMHPETRPESSVEWRDNSFNTLMEKGTVGVIVGGMDGKPKTTKVTFVSDETHECTFFLDDQWLEVLPDVAGTFLAQRAFVEAISQTYGPNDEGLDNLFYAVRLLIRRG